MMDWAAFDWQPFGDDEFRAWDGEKWIYRTNYAALYGDNEYYEDDDESNEDWLKRHLSLWLFDDDDNNEGVQ